MGNEEKENNSQSPQTGVIKVILVLLIFGYCITSYIGSPYTTYNIEYPYLLFLGISLVTSLLLFFYFNHILSNGSNNTSIIVRVLLIPVLFFLIFLLLKNSFFYLNGSGDSSPTKPAIVTIGSKIYSIKYSLRTDMNHIISATDSTHREVRILIPTNMVNDSHPGGHFQLRLKSGNLGYPWPASISFSEVTSN